MPGQLPVVVALGSQAVANPAWRTHRTKEIHP